MSRTKLTGCNGAVAAALAVVAGAANAVEGYSTHGGLGYSDSLMGFPVPPGLYVRDDVKYLRATRLNDRNGDRVQVDLGPSAIQGFANNLPSLVAGGVIPSAVVPLLVPELQAKGKSGVLGYSAADFKVEGTFNTFALFYQSRLKWLGSDGVGFGIFVPYASQRVTLTTSTPAYSLLNGAIPVPSSPVDLGSRVNSLGDTTIVPLYLAYRLSDTLSVNVNPLKVIVKTGRFDPNARSNYGHGYNSWEPGAGITWFSGQLELSADLNLLVNEKNKDTNYKSGKEVYSNFAARWWFNQTWQAGVSGYWYKQIGDDKVNGVAVNTVNDGTNIFGPAQGKGNRASAWAIGPTLTYNHDTRLSFTAHWDHDVDAKNYTQGDSVWLRVTYKFD